MINRTENAGGGSSESYPLMFEATQGQVITVGGLASMASPRVVGVVNSSNTYKTEGAITYPGGLMSGATYFLDADVPGAISATSPTTEGHYVVVIGRAIDENTLDLEIGSPILL